MRSKNTIVIFIAVSLLLHAILLLQITQQDIILPAEAGNIMSITITQNNITEEIKHKKIIKPNEKFLEKKSVEIKSEIKHLTKKINPNQLAQATIKNTDTSELVKTSSSSSKIKIISLLRDEIQQHFYYPKLAQRRNWQGKVQLAFDVNTHGSIKNVTVQKTSGHEILDNAAMSALNKVSTIPDYWVQQEYFSNLKLTIKYRLEEI